MQLMTFNEILTSMCDNFDSLISPKTIARTNNNIIYLMFKAIAKGYEVINNICVVLSNKFNPESCSVEDLESIASLVGTERLSGSASGLNISIKNTSGSAVALYAGTYSYALDEDTIFTFDVLQSVSVPSNETVTYIAFSEKRGNFPVTAQSNINVTANVQISPHFNFSCGNNEKLLGTTEETDLEFRNRINTDTTRQDSIVELQTALKNLPYIFDARVYFNNTLEPVIYDDISVPPYHMAIFYSGEPKNEIAEIVASKSIFPTIQGNGAVLLQYNSSVFATGAYNVYIIPFEKKQYKVNIAYKIDSIYVNKDSLEAEIEDILKNKLNTQLHVDYIKEVDVYNAIAEENLAGVSILNVDLLVDDVPVAYVDVPISRISYLIHVNCEEVVNG